MDNNELKKLNEFKNVTEKIKKGSDYDLQTLIKAICLKPYVFVGTNETRAVCSFINGYASARDEFWTEIKEFQRWLPKKLNYPANWVWYWGLEKTYPLPEDALREMYQLYDEFKNLKKL